MDEGLSKEQAQFTC